jgi:purine-cytosine permease-like protein
LKIGSIAIGFIPQIFCFGVMGGLGIWFGVTLGESNPGVYIVTLLGLGGVLFTVLTQVRINVTNIYSSSLSLSSFFENIFGFKPGRRFWVVVGGVTAMILMLGGIVDHLGTAMTFQGIALMSWAAVLVTDALVLKKWLKISPRYYESRQENLYRWNPVGVISLIVPTVIGTIAALGYMGTFLQSTAAFFAALMAAILTVILGITTKGRYFMKREANDIPKEDWIA